MTVCPYLVLRFLNNLQQIHEKIVEFLSNKTEKLTKITNKSLKSIKNNGTVQLTPSKIELFISFDEEFKLKYYRKLPKTTIFPYCGSGEYHKCVPLLL
jgi:hypothetical protein